MELPGGIPPDRDSSYSCQSQQQPSSSSNLNTSSSSGQQSLASSIGISIQQQSQPICERLSRPMSFDKMENLVREMQDPELGVPVRSQKLFLTSIPSAFMGYDLIEWMMERLTIEESEALSIANQLCLHGYFFPVNDVKTLVVKDDSSLYRFQTPYYWPWQHKAPDNVEYAIYLAKRSLRNKQRHGLEEYESEALASLHKNLKAKWDFITMQAEEQVKLAKDRKKGDKIVGDSQERAYWRVHRPPPGQFTPLEPCPVPSRDRQGKPRRRTAEDMQREVDYLKASMGRTRMKMSQACESLTQYCETFCDYDFFIQPVLPSNPWVTEDITFWQLNNTIVDIPTEKRVKRWSISIEELVSDPTGLQEFTAYLKKEYSHENIRFWIAVNDLRRSAHSQISRKVKEIYEEFLEPGAPCEINIDGKTMEKVQSGLKTPSRYTFDAAAEHIYALLLKKDCYPRFVRSEHYKSLLATGIQPSHKKRFFGFGVPKKKSSTAPPIQALLTQVPGPSVPTPGNLARRRGSDRSLSGSAHELAVLGVKDGTNKVPHSHSQSNLSDIPYSVVIYRGDMPTAGLPLPVTMEDPSLTSTATGVVKEANSKKYQDVSKNVIDTLETTMELGTSSVVCPWDVTESVDATVSVSVCPWDTDEPTFLPPNTSARPRNNSAIESGSSSSDISEVSDRMRRSCGLRQNTLDCELFGGKRLTPAVTEQRRASMTVAPRMSDLQFSFRHQQSSPAAVQSSVINTTNICTSQIETTTTTTATTTSTITNPAAPKSKRPSTSQLSLNLFNKLSFEDREEFHILPTTITEECAQVQDHQNPCPQKQIETEQLISEIQNVKGDTHEKTLNNFNVEIKKENLVKSNNSECDQIVTTQQKEQHRATPSVIATFNTGDASTTVELISTTTNVTATATSSTLTYGTTPTINVVCPVGEEVTPMPSPPLPSLPLPNTTSSTSTSPQPTSTPTITEDIEEMLPIIIIPPQIPPPPPSPSSSIVLSEQINLDVHSFDDIPQEELSPTTEEYQECCVPDDDYQYNITTVGEMLEVGCVAPAPTPAPSIAPLAEVEAYPPDDEIEPETVASVTAVTAPMIPTTIEAVEKMTSATSSTDTVGVDHKKKHKKKKSFESKTDKDVGPMDIVAETTPTTTTVETCDDPQNRNAVCPWEDDDAASSTDATFVKTYATLGYL